MGEEEQAQQKPPRISPETKEKIKRFLGKAGLLVAGGAIGAGIGVAVQYSIMQNAIFRMQEREQQRQCLTDYDMDSAGRSAIGGVAELIKIIVERYKERPQALSDAVGGLQSVSGTYDFEPQKMALLKKIVEDGGENASYALRILGAMAKQGGYSDSLLDEQLAGRIVALAGLLAERCGEDAQGILDYMVIRGIFSQYNWQAPGPLGRLAFAESMFRNAKDAGMMKYFEEIYIYLEHRGENSENYEAYADSVFATLRKVEDNAGSLAPLARNHIRALMANNLQRRSGESDQQYADRRREYAERVAPSRMIKAIGFIADRYPDGERVAGMLGLMANVLRRGGANPAVFDIGYANEICFITERQNAASGISDIHLMRLLNLFVENPRFNPDGLNRPFAENAGRMLDLGAAKAGQGRFGEFFAEISEIMHKYGQFRPAGERMDFEGLVDALRTFAEMDPDADTFMRHIKMVKSMAWQSGIGDGFSADFAARICGMEAMVAERSRNGRAAAEAVEKLEGVYFSPGMARLVEIMAGGLENGRVANAINSITRTIEREDLPFGNNTKTLGIRPGDYDDAYALVQALFPGERMDLERLINFAYGVSVVGAERTRTLNKVLGMKYFFRYRPELLREVVSNIDLTVPDGRPVFLAVFTQSDWNGTFYYSSDSIANLTRHYRVIIVETLYDAVMFREINRIAGQYGRLAGLSISGHGSEYGVSLGPNGYFSGADGQEVTRLQDSFDANPVIVFDSCSTGRYGDAIAGIFQNITGSRIYAPVRPSNVAGYNLDGNGAIIDAYHNVPTRVYENGQSRVTGNAE